MRVLLAPMEGVVDFHMRELLTLIGGIDQCVTEFLRVSNRVFPERVFYKICPELHNNSETLAGTPVHLQLLGQDPDILAENALIAAKLGVRGVDLNFGCPAKTVNKHKGGAVLLDEPDKLYNIIKTVRSKVPSHIPVSAKIRLGTETPDNVITIAKMIEQAGANELTVHARTKKQAYKPPAQWHWIEKINKELSINVIANGDVSDYQSYKNCIDTSQSRDVMVGRGILSNPFLADDIKQKRQSQATWSQILPLLLYKTEYLIEGQSPRYFPSRTKQWLNYLRKHFSEAQRDFTSIRAMQDADEIIGYFNGLIK